jgi:hypothetical protein
MYQYCDLRLDVQDRGLRSSLCSYFVLTKLMLCINFEHVIYLRLCEKYEELDYGHQVRIHSQGVSGILADI